MLIRPSRTYCHPQAALQAAANTLHFRVTPSLGMATGHAVRNQQMPVLRRLSVELNHQANQSTAYLHRTSKVRWWGIYSTY